jgi:hypothetical protein
MSVALRLYEQLTEAGEDKTRAKVIAEAFEQLEKRYPEVKDLATQGHIRESELRLQKEIEKVRLEIKELEGRLQKEIEKIRLEMKELEVRLVAAMHRQTIWVITAVGAIVGLFRLLDLFFGASPIGG